MPPIIQVRDLSKRYIISHEGKENYTALRDVIAKNAKKIFSTGSSKSDQITKEEFWALQNINFDIQQGDRVGIIGRNGAGKSTLLKILSRITEPTSGSIKVRGRVASLLEVGTGFHPELSGRENIFLNGAILGMSRAEIKKHFDAIVDFAEIEKFLDTPVKRYSSGMYVRLAFAVAAHLEPEILVVDEVLAVGDAQFQKKCLGKMEDVSKNDGRTVLFVSHNISALQNLCTTSILLNKGTLSFEGKLSEGVSLYLKSQSSSNTHVSYSLSNAPQTEYSKFLKAEVNATHPQNSIIRTGEPIEFSFMFYYLKDSDTQLDISFHLVDELGNLVFVGSTVYNEEEPKVFNKGEITASCLVPENIMHEGTYNISRLLLVKDRGQIVQEIKDVIQFEIINKASGLGWMGEKEGIIKPKLLWKF